MPPQINQNPQTQEISSEQQREKLLHLLPKELRERWEKETEELNDIEAIKILRTVLLSRKEVKEKIFTNIYNIKSEEIKKEVRLVLENIERTFGDTNYFLGNGSVAEIYEMPCSPHICTKYLVNPKRMMEHGNNFREESDHLEEMHDFEVEGIRVPELYFYHMSDFGTCFGMEKIFGKSLNVIIEKPEDCPFINEIKKLDSKEVLRKFKLFVEKMHSERKIVHHDLDERNIMIDENLNWFVIDFGRAKRLEIGGDDIHQTQQDVDTAQVESSIKTFFKKLQAIDK